MTFSSWSSVSPVACPSSFSTSVTYAMTVSIFRREDDEIRICRRYCRYSAGRQTTLPTSGPKTPRLFPASLPMSAPTPGIWLTVPTAPRISLVTSGPAIVLRPLISVAMRLPFPLLAAAGAAAAGAGGAGAGAGVAAGVWRLFFAPRAPSAVNAPSTMGPRPSPSMRPLTRESGSAAATALAGERVF